MKRIASIILALCLLCGCTGAEDDIGRSLRFREKMLTNGCTFIGNISANYSDRIYTFQVGCSADPDGNISFRVLSPDSISGITGEIRAEGGFLTFDGEMLAFPLLADGEVSPVSAPWLLIHTLRSGYLSGAGMDGEYLQMVLNDSYEEDALQVDVWLNELDQPVRADILWQGRRILAITIEEFAFV